MAAPSVPQRAPTARELRANEVAQRLDRPIGFLGIGALVLWLAEPSTASLAELSLLVDAAWIVITVAFAVEFTARVIVAPETWPFLRKHWWELALVALPFLRVLRAGRAGRGVASAVRSSRRAGAKLRSRLTYLVIITVVVALVSGRLLWEFGAIATRTPRPSMTQRWQLSPVRPSASLMPSVSFWRSFLPLIQWSSLRRLPDPWAPSSSNSALHLRRSETPGGSKRNQVPRKVRRRSESSPTIPEAAGSGSPYRSTGSERRRPAQTSIRLGIRVVALCLVEAGRSLPRQRSVP